MAAAQEEEKRRINAHYDEELARLKPLWAQATARTAASEQPAVRR